MKSNHAPAPAATKFPAALRVYLYVTAALTGAVIMIVEILGAKMLAPFFGASHFVWTAQIAVTLVALACGYYVGGRWVDRRQRLGQLYAAILLAAVYLAFTIRFCERTAYACLKLNLPTGSLLASALLFFVPLTLLAMVGPFFIRVLTDSVSRVGGNAGRLTAVSTFGSFLGTLLIGYLLVPFFPNSATMFGAAFILMALALIYFLVWGRSRRGTAAAALVLAIGAATGLVGLRPQPWQVEGARELARRNSNFGELQVLEVEHHPLRFLLNDYMTQNVYDTAEHKSASAFSYMLHGLAQAYAPQLDRVLCIGLGVGCVPMEFARDGAEVDVVEINPAIVPLAEQYFDLKPELLRIHYGDGRYFLNVTPVDYDAVILDAFLGDSSPSHLMTREAFNQVKRALKPEGVLVVNTFGTTRPDRNFLTASIHKTLTNVFASVRVHVARGNVLFVASSRPSLQFLRQVDLSQVHPRCAEIVREGFDFLHEPEPADGLLLTDDHNPAEFYDAANREEYRLRVAMSMQRHP